MPNLVHRPTKPVCSAVILAALLLFVVACGAEAVPPTAQPSSKKAQPTKIARRVASAEPQSTPVPAETTPRVKKTKRAKTAEPANNVPENAPTEPTKAEVAKSSIGTAMDAAVPKGAGTPAARLVIPKMKLDAAVQDATMTVSQQAGQLYADWFIPFDAVGHIATTVNPGELGNMVISGHHNLVGPNKFGKGLFGGLWDLQAGDLIYVVDRSNRTFAYAVSKSYNVKEAGESFAVREEHGREILADTGAPVLTLITCWNGAQSPYSGNTYRWIVTANLVEGTR